MQGESELYRALSLVGGIHLAAQLIPDDGDHALKKLDHDPLTEALLALVATMLCPPQGGYASQSAVPATTETAMGSGGLATPLGAGILGFVLGKSLRERGDSRDRGDYDESVARRS
jgi:hypothetical protein